MIYKKNVHRTIRHAMKCPVVFYTILFLTPEYFDIFKLNEYVINQVKT